MNSLKHITTARKLSSLETIELAMDDVCRTLDVDGPKAFFITLAISELASNMIRHGSSSSKSSDDLTVEVFSTSITVVLEDRCDPIPKAVAKNFIENDGTISEYDTTLCNLPESGWGLDLVHSAASSVLYKRKQHRNIYEVAFELMSVA
jgi:anti-sigma regulatory factor (Ser/Thr protein kinase)